MKEGDSKRINNIWILGSTIKTFPEELINLVAVK